MLSLPTHYTRIFTTASHLTRIFQLFFSTSFVPHSPQTLSRRPLFQIGALAEFLLSNVRHSHCPRPLRCQRHRRSLLHATFGDLRRRKALKHRESVRHTRMGITREKNSSHLSTSPCSHLRAAYHNCFNRWCSEKFVKGHWEKEECISEWQKYRACLSEHLDDKHLSRFLEAETVVDAAIKDDSGNQVDGAATRVPQ